VVNVSAFQTALPLTALQHVQLQELHPSQLIWNVAKDVNLPTDATQLSVQFLLAEEKLGLQEMENAVLSASNAVMRPPSESATEMTTSIADLDTTEEKNAMRRSQKTKGNRKQSLPDSAEEDPAIHCHPRNSDSG